MNTVHAARSGWLRLSDGSTLKVLKGREYDADNVRVAEAVHKHPDAFDLPADESEDDDAA